MSKYLFGALASLFLGPVSQGITILHEDFESPNRLPAPYYFTFVQGQDISGWNVINDNHGERPYLVDEARHVDLGLEFFGQQALRLNEGSGIERSISLVAGQTYQFSMYGYGNLDIPLEVRIGSQLSLFNFGAYTLGLQERTFDFTATESGEVLLQIFNPNFDKDFRQRTIDNITIVTVPDGGSSLMLFGIALLGTAFARRAVSRR